MVEINWDTFRKIHLTVGNFGNALSYEVEQLTDEERFEINVHLGYILDRVTRMNEIMERGKLRLKGEK